MNSLYLRDIRSRFRSELSPEYPLQEIESIFHLLIIHYFQYPRTILAMEPEKELTPEEFALLLNALADLKAHRPVQHIIGHAYFMEMQLLVSPDVLIPRPETAELVAWAASEFSDSDNQLTILDAGTGSGCIALGMKKYLPDSSVYGIDISDAALEIARSNANAQNMEISFCKADLLNPDSGLPKFDIIASNPPYIPIKEAASLLPHVRLSEPHLALFVPDDKPLLYYRSLCDFAVCHLNNEGWMYLECHERYTIAVGDLLERRGFSRVEVKKDIFEKNRFVRGKWNASLQGETIL